MNRQRLTYETKASGYNYEQIKAGFRTFLIAPDDRKEGYEIGDLLIIQKYSNDKKVVGEYIVKVIIGFQKKGAGLMSGHLVLSIESVKERKENE